ncbi:hypothetical protein L6164_018123 [Bauhinia variegata]|uniref:Uncharacterized protein n=1 Tax=Bauhinia variegata TaxID=167791 RepID=A0ACB9NAA3_BAUVA|nr:hypothetical protein L6164_018123 [Bauhinia variegata]
MKEVLLLSIIICSLSILPLAEAKPGNGFSIDLIYRDSPLSPFYNPSMTSSELIRSAALRSTSRIRDRFNLSSDGKTRAESVIVPNRGDYLMKIFIGTPPVETLAVADTGSDLIWVQCLPCEHCYPQQESIFDPKKSSTYKVISCDSKSCRSMFRSGCGSSGQCRYYYSYGDESFTVGDLASESIRLGSNGDQALTLSKSIFGCGHDNYGQFSSKSTGLVGLGAGPLSLVSQLGAQIDHKFSYCLLPYYANSTSKLKFGRQAIISGKGVVSTPLVYKSKSTYYYLTLEGVTIGEKTVQTDKRVGNIVIDSGTTLTLLESSFYDRFVAMVKEAIGTDHEPVQDPPEPFKLCYEYGTIEIPPDMTLHFSGADLHLQRINTFVKLENLVCLVIAPNERFSVFGNFAQVNFKVEYDLKQKRVSFAPADCGIMQ